MKLSSLLSPQMAFCMDKECCTIEYEDLKLEGPKNLPSSDLPVNETKLARYDYIMARTINYTREEILDLSSIGCGISLDHLVDRVSILKYIEGSIGGEVIHPETDRGINISFK